MRFALDTYRDVVSGDRNRMISALLTLALWFVAGAYTVSVLSSYTEQYETLAVSLLGGAVVSSVVAAVKLT